MRPLRELRAPGDLLMVLPRDSARATATLTRPRTGLVCGSIPQLPLGVRAGTVRPARGDSRRACYLSLHIGLSGSSAHITRRLAAPLLLLSVVAPLQAARRGGSFLLRRCLRLCEGREYIPCAVYLVCRPVAVPAGYPSGAPRASLVCLRPSSSTRFATPFDCAPNAQPGEREIRARAPLGFPLCAFSTSAVPSLRSVYEKGTLRTLYGTRRRIAPCGLQRRR